MDTEKKIRIIGGKSLHGEVYISGSKNSISAILPVLCIVDDDCRSVIENVPDIDDVETICNILREIGMHVKYDKANKTIEVWGKAKKHDISELYAPKIRASSIFLGALVSSAGIAKMPFCGGDKIGTRPLDIHFYVLDKFNVKVEIQDGQIICTANEFPLKGTSIFLRYPSVGATENAIILAAKAVGDSYIYNAACEPEITDLVMSLSSMGANITGAGTPIIHVRGVEKIHCLHHEVIPDRLETGTFALAFAVTKGRGKIIGGIPKHNVALFSTLKDAGVKIEYSNSDIYVDAVNCSFKAIKVNTLPYPGMPTDIQPMLSVFAALCSGNSVIKEDVFEDRFAYINEYQKMGVNVMNSYNQAVITGPQSFKNAVVRGGDIRTVTCLILAALTAQNESIVYGVEHLFRGYDNFVDKLQKLGADIKII